VVTISACAIALLAFAVFIHCERTNYGISEAFQTNVALNLDDAVNVNSEQKVAQLSEHYQIPRDRVSGFLARCKAVIQFAHVVFFMPNDREEELIRRNELTAEKLLEDYQKFIVLPPEERVDRFLKWRDDIAYFENNKHSPLSIKSDVVEFKVD